MATSILPGGHSHFHQGQQYYPQNDYNDFSHNSIVMPTSQSQYQMLNPQEEPLPLATSQTWPNHVSGRRGSSKSPNASERTPIRHSRTHPSRARSTSGSEALLAYATEQSLQQQQQPPLTSSTLIQQTTPMSSPPIFTPQAFPSMTPASPFLQQQNYYDAHTSAFGDLQGHTISHGMGDYYPVARGELHTSPMGSTSINPQEALYLQQAGQSRSQALPSMSSQALNFPPISRPLESTSSNIEVSSSRNKPQCWDHGCNGRQFSTFSNLLRHQREKSGTAAKARCPHCGTEFTRTTARNGHMYGGKCKGLPDSSKRSSISDSVEKFGD